MSCKNFWAQEIAGRLQGTARVAAGQVDGAARCTHEGCDALVNLATNCCVRGHAQGPMHGVAYATALAGALACAAREAVQRGQVEVTPAVEQLLRTDTEHRVRELLGQERVAAELRTADRVTVLSLRDRVQVVTRSDTVQTNFMQERAGALHVEEEHFGNYDLSRRSADIVDDYVAARLRRGWREHCRLCGQFLPDEGEHTCPEGRDEAAEAAQTIQTAMHVLGDLDARAKRHDPRVQAGRAYLAARAVSATPTDAPAPALPAAEHLAFLQREIMTAGDSDVFEDYELDEAMMAQVEQDVNQAISGVTTPTLAGSLRYFLDEVLEPFQESGLFESYASEDPDYSDKWVTALDEVRRYLGDAVPISRPLPRAGVLDALGQAVKQAKTDLGRIMPQVEPSGDREQPGWQTIKELQRALRAYERKPQSMAAQTALLAAARCADADLQGIMPEFEPSGDKEDEGWRTLRDLGRAIRDAELSPPIVEQEYDGDLGNAPIAEMAAQQTPDAPPVLLQEKEGSQSMLLVNINGQGVAAHILDDGVILDLAGYDTKTAAEGYGGGLVYLALEEDGTPFLYVWADRGEEDPTHIIGLGGAAERYRVLEEDEPAGEVTRGRPWHEADPAAPGRGQVVALTGRDEPPAVATRWDNEQAGAVSIEPNGVSLDVRGYGTAAMAPGYGGGIVHLDLFHPKAPVLLVWADVNYEEPTHRIPLAGAREPRAKSRRRQ